ncbi:hypothetical protein SCALM49S_02162 [Streptomyces californicus]
MPFGLRTGAAMFCSVLAVRKASHGDAALGSRLLVWTFAGAAAWFNWVHAPRGMDHAGAPHFLAGMSLSAAVLFDRALNEADPPGGAARTGPGAAPVAADPDRPLAAGPPGDLRRLVAACSWRASAHWTRRWTR